jgi:hypothetical protein
VKDSFSIFRLNFLPLIVGLFCLAPLGATEEKPEVSISCEEDNSQDKVTDKPAAEEKPAANPQQIATNKYKIDTNRFIFERILDNEPIQSESVNPQEFDAYNHVISFAHQFEASELESVARRDLTFKDLFRPIRNEFRMDIVYFEGLLRRLRSIGPNSKLKEAGVEQLYEGWLVPRGQPNPVCILITSLPPGVSAQHDLKKDKLDKWVSFAGYSFKLMAYESAEFDPKNPTQGKKRLAPLLMGKSVRVLDSQIDETEAVWHKTFLPVILCSIGIMTVTVFVLAWWYRRGDEYVRQTIINRQEQNPW